MWRARFLNAATTTAALEDARANAGAGQSVELQPGGETWAEAYVATGDLRGKSRS